MNRMKLSAAALLLAAALLPGAGCLRAEHGAACGQRCCARPKHAAKRGRGAGAALSKRTGR